jgi:hypothetical protein
LSTIEKVEEKCPLCGETFDFWAQRSCYIAGVNLDFKPYGMAMIPEPVPHCPKCGLVFPRSLFPDSKVAELAAKVKESNIFEVFPNMPSYFYLAKELELLNFGIEKVIHYYIRAIWQSTKDSFMKISSLVIDYFNKLDNSHEDYYTYKLMKLDFLRRQKEFEKAREVIKEIKNDNNFPHSKENRILLEYQEELINIQDIDEHPWPKENKKEREENELLGNIKINIIIDSPIDTKTYEYLQDITLLKSSKLFYKINNRLPIISNSINSDKILDIITYLKSEKINAIIGIINRSNNSQKSVILSELEKEEVILKNFKNKVYKMFSKEKR